MENNIIRYYPNKKQIFNNIDYPKRTSINDVNKIKELSTDKKYNDDYIKQKSGKNYESKNKIKIGGNLHTRLEEKFILNFIVDHSNFTLGNYTYYLNNFKQILFSDVDSVDWDKYFLETKRIYSEIKNQNEIINEKK